MPAYAATPDGEAGGARPGGAGGLRDHRPHRVDLPAPGRRRLRRRRTGPVPPLGLAGLRLRRLRDGHARDEGADRRRASGPTSTPRSTTWRRWVHAGTRPASSGSAWAARVALVAGADRALGAAVTFYGGGVTRRAGSASSRWSSWRPGCRPRGWGCSATSTRASPSTTSRPCAPAAAHGVGRHRGGPLRRGRPRLQLRRPRRLPRGLGHRRLGPHPGLVRPAPRLRTGSGGTSWTLALVVLVVRGLGWA